MKTSEMGARGGEKMKLLRISILLLGFIILSIPALADTLYLKDGRFYRGKYMKGDKNGVQFKSDDKIMGFPLVSVSFISVGEKDSKDHPANEMGNGVLKGMVTCSRLNSDRGPDFGAKVYACKIRGDNILIFYKYDELLRSNEIDDFIKDYIKYRWAKWNRNLLWRQDLKPEKAKDILAGKQSQLKELGADTEKGWERVRDRGRAVLEKLDRGEIPSRLALAERDGGFSFQLPAGYYFLLAQSQENRLEDAYTAVKISDGRTTGISLEIIFLQLGNQGDSPLN